MGAHRYRKLPHLPNNGSVPAVLKSDDPNLFRPSLGEEIGANLAALQQSPDEDQWPAQQSMQHVIQNLPPYTVRSQIASTLVDGAILASFLTVISIIRVNVFQRHFRQSSSPGLTTKLVGK